MTSPTRQTPLTLNYVVDTLRRLGCDPVERRGEYLAHCPAHDDNRASLSISRGDDNPVVWYCHAGCNQEDVMDVLLGNRPPVQRSGKSSSRRKRSGSGRSYSTATWYDYRDEEGNLLYQHGRTPDKQFPFRMPDGSWGLADDVRRVPYRLHELASAPAGSFVFIVEGEKDADRLASLGLLATCNDNGAGKWNEDFARYFEGLHVAILPDNDEPGRKHAQAVAANVATAAESVKVLQLPDLPEKGDVSDWLDDGHDVGELVATVYDTSEWQPPAEEVQVDKPLIDPFERKALWLIWRTQDLDAIPEPMKPMLARRHALLEGSDNPITKTVYEVVQGKALPAGNRTLQQVVDHALDEISRYAPPGHLDKLLQLATTAPEASAAADLLQQATGREAVMVAPEPTYFQGDYPSAGVGHSCETYYKVRESGNDESIWQRHTARLWRPRMVEGLYMERCDGCYHDRVWRLCNQIEREAERYHCDEVPLRVVTLANEKERQRILSRARNWRQREDVDFTYLALTQKDGTVVFVHNQPDRLDGDELPRDRAALYGLIHDAADTPEGKRESSSKGWGGNYRGMKGDGRRGREDADEGEGKEERVELLVKGGARLNTMIEELYHTSIPGRGRRRIPIVDLVDLLDAAGIDYAVTAGQERLSRLKQENVTHKAHLLTGENKDMPKTSHGDPPEGPVPLSVALFGGTNA